ncbi:helix-turn-helix domain-containing protein [Streptomyces sp. DSM 44915]|uniref:Helix-turn-helix domain-containing protein n=1 Tax=Streptomyces chisholmiae TaxID=3075540 RepID=A0ABU2JN58_9ACTN|nr:helix-turn-helix domain-containing protein [Streptomyces sp. DSM 44915]MDT0265939.1 helix-turn-helix domain-containing protein [Streptomyces sp. DSM 44915]
MTEDHRSAARRPPNDGPRAAARNRAALIAAARQVYAEQGLDAPLSAIARRAGVGQGVLYRHFPDRGAVATAVLEENVRQIEEAAARAATLPEMLGIVSWHLTDSAAFISLLHLDEASRRSDETHAYALDLSRRVEDALRSRTPAGHRLAGAGDLMLAIAMVAGAVTGRTPEERARRALAAWRLLDVEVGAVRPLDG